MCGIFGSFSFKQTKDNYRNSLNAIEHRGPDDEGCWIDEVNGVVLTHKRLAILDLSSSGHQPMYSAEDRYIIVFNGEIYNHLAIREELQSSGIAPVWRGHSDTETLLAGFDRWGITDTVNRTVGMFAFAVWDKKLENLTLCRDRLGEKPLYYSLMNDTFLFGSDLASFKVHDNFTEDIDRDALALFMRHSYIPAPYTIYKNTFKLKPGTSLTISHQNRDLKAVDYWDLNDVITNGLANPFNAGVDEAVIELEGMLLKSVNQQMLASDVPLGAFLSGGIDSSLIVSLMQAQSSRPVKTFTIGFNDSAYNEAEHAKLVAKHLGTDHTEIYISPEEALNVVPNLGDIYSEPFADSSQIPTFLVSKLAREHVTVALTGDAGDELFCGYRTYPLTDNLRKKIFTLPYGLRKVIGQVLSDNPGRSKNKFIPAMFDLLAPALGSKSVTQKIFKVANLMSMKSADEFYQALVSKWESPTSLVIGSKELPTIFTSHNQLPGDISYVQQMMAIDLLSYLPDNNLCKVDRAAMAVSLETRVPMLDHRIIEFAWSLPQEYKLKDGISKWPLRQILYKYVPQKIIDRPKMGFSVPLGSWLSGPLRNWAEELLNESRLYQEGYLNATLVRQRWKEHLSGKRNWQYHLWNVLMFQSWLEKQKNESF